MISKKVTIGILAIILSTSLIWFLSHRVTKPTPTSQVSTITSIERPDINLAPLSTNIAGVKTDSKFSINTDPKNLKVSPFVPFTTKKQSDGSYIISFNKILDPKQRYDFTLPVIIKEAQAFEYKWSYTTNAPPKILYSLPTDKSTTVPLNSPIEFYFTNNNVDTQIKDYFEITPKVEGTFEKHLNSITFVPESFEPNKIYTVRVKKGLPYNDNSAKMEEDYVFQFSTDINNNNNSKITSSRIIYNFSPDEIPGMDIGFNANNNPSTVKLEIYPYSEAYFFDCFNILNLPYWAKWSYNPMCKTPEQAKFITEIPVKGNDNSYGKYIDFPDRLGEGYYLARIHMYDSFFFALFQISNLSAGVKIYEKQSVVWVNDIASKAPLANATISDNKNNFGNTNNQGVLVVENNKYSKDYNLDFLKISYNSKVLYVPVSETINAQEIVPEYWQYFYTDRNIYLPVDSINFWGFIKPKDDANSLAKVTVNLEDGNSNIISTQYIDMTSKNTIMGKFDFKNLPSGYYNLVFYDQQKNRIGTHYFTIDSFIKPLYKITAKPEKNVIWEGDSNTVLVEVKFYDNTPVANTEFTVSGDNELNFDKTIKTDATGKVRINVKSSYSNTTNSNVQWHSIYISPKNQISGDINTSVSFNGLNHQVSFRDKKDSWKDGKLTYSTKLVKLNLADMQNDPYKNDGEILKNYEISVKVDRKWEEKVDAGEYYDPIEKQTIKKYDYIHKSETVFNQKVISDNNGLLNFSFDAPKDNQYDVTFNFKDTLNRDSSANDYASSYNNYNYSNSYSISLTKESGKYKLGEEIELLLSKNGETIPNNSINRHLIIFSKDDGIINTQVTSESRYKFNFEKNFIPNIGFNSLWFDGSHYHSSSESNYYYDNNILYDKSDEIINLFLKTDKEKYQPGDIVNLKINTKDASDQAIKAKVLVSVIDGSINDLDYSNGNGEILSSIYSTHSNRPQFQYLSHITVQDLILGAEGGGGGGDDRTDFKNTAYFNEVETDSNGEATLSFKAPDNVTSWRASAVAVNSNLKGGENSILIPVTKNLFVNYLSTDEFLTGDKPTVTAVTYGGALNNDSILNYSLEIPSLNYKFEKTDAKSFTPIDIPLGNLGSGVHKLTLRSQSGENKDGIVKYITILPTRQYNPAIKYQNVTSNFKLDSVSDFPVKISIGPYGLNAILAKSKNININYSSRRLDSYVASLILSEINNSGNLSNYSSDAIIRNYRPNCGFYKLVPNSGDDGILSSKVISSGVDKSCGLDYNKELFDKELNSKTDSVEVISGRIWHLAELTHNTNVIIQPFLSQTNTPLGWLYLALASCANNDPNTAQKIVADNLAKYYTQQSPFAYLNLGGNKESNLQASALAMMVYAKLGDFQKVTELWNYLDSNNSKENIYVLEKALTLKYSMNSIPQYKTDYEYYLNDKWQKDLSEITVYPDQQKNFAIRTTSPVSLKIVSYGQTINNSSALPSLNIKYNPINIDLNLYEITADYKIDPTFEGEYQIQINLPSNLEFISDAYNFIPSAWEFYNYPNYADRHSLNFSVYSGYNRPLKFIVKNTTKGEFIFEPGIIYYNQSTNLLNASSPIPNFISR